MAIVAEMSWDEVSHPAFGTTPVPPAFREAVTTVAARARAAFPESHTRIDEAVTTVLSGGVELFADGTGRVTSQEGDTLQYHIVNGHCDCADVAQAPEGWCVHRLSVAIARRAKEQAAQPGEELAVRQLPPSLPEAPASVNCHVTILGRQVQVTLRDTDETRLLERLTALLARYPVPDASTGSATPPQASAAMPEGFCHVHQVQMRLNTKEGRNWYSHKREDGSWCKGK